MNGAVLVLAAIASPQPQDAAVAPPRPFPTFEKILWLHGGPARDARFFEHVRRLGFTAVSVSVAKWS